MTAPFSEPDPRPSSTRGDTYAAGDSLAGRNTLRSEPSAHRPHAAPPRTQAGAQRASGAVGPRRRGRMRDDATGTLFPEDTRADSSHGSERGGDAPARPATHEESILLRGALQGSLSPETFLTWFTRSKLIAHEGDAAVIAVPNSFARDWIERHYSDVLTNCAVAVLGPGRVAVVREAPEALVADATAAERARANADVDEIEPAGDGAYAEEPAAGPAPAPERAAPPARRPMNGRAAPIGHGRRQSRAAALTDAGRSGRLHRGSDLVLNPKCTFDSFVVGPCNRFGHAAALGASEQPGRSYNPLFVHGRVGVGKTHLLQAFCHSILETLPDAKILYLSCETFVNHFIDALENGSTQEFREKYRNIDVLVVDDVQVLANKEKTQEEFFHTFNQIYNAGKQIVLSSDSPPKDIPTLQDRLVSRFKWGMVCELEPPCLETRMAIVKRKARERGVEMPDDVIAYIAENIHENVREIEGAVTRLLGYTALSNAPLDLETARETLAGIIEVRRGAPTIDDIVSVVTAHFQVKLSELQSKRRTKTIAFPRQVAMFLARKLTRHSLGEIGGFFGGRDHTTVMYAVDRIQKSIEADQKLALLVQEFVERLAGRRAS